MFGITVCQENLKMWENLTAVRAQLVNCHMKNLVRKYRHHNVLMTKLLTDYRQPCLSSWAMLVFVYLSVMVAAVSVQYWLLCYCYCIWIMLFVVVNFVTELFRRYCGQGYAFHYIWWWACGSLCIFYCTSFVLWRSHPNKPRYCYCLFVHLFCVGL